MCDPDRERRRLIGLSHPSLSESVKSKSASLPRVLPGRGPGRCHRYVELIRDLLADGGVWINLGVRDAAPLALTQGRANERAARDTATRIAQPSPPPRPLPAKKSAERSLRRRPLRRRPRPLRRLRVLSAWETYLPLIPCAG